MMSFTKRLLVACLIPFVLTACGGGGGGGSGDPEPAPEPNVNGIPSLKNLYAYQTSSQSSQILNCAKIFLDRQSCSVTDIKPIGVDVSGDISINDIKSRLVVSHDWMADSFIAALQHINDQDLLNLFKPLNAIVISYEIRPAFYHGLTASMYIDPRYLWRSTSDWNSIYQQNDYRGGFQTEFQFIGLSRYVKKTNSDYVTWSNSYNATSYNTRSASQISPGLFRLLAHELAHANDYLSSEVLNSIGDTGTIWGSYISQNKLISKDLTDSIPLTSDLLNDAAKIAFHGESMTDTIRNTTALEAGIAMKNDGAAEFYGYSTEREDLAMLFEAYMMYKKYDAVSDIAFVKIPTAEPEDCDDYVIEWGQRNRLADSQVKQRAIMIANRVFNTDVTSELASLSSAATEMTADVGWCASRYGNANAATAFSLERSTRSSDVVHDYRDDRVRQLELHQHLQD